MYFFGKMLDVLTTENQQLRSNGDLHFDKQMNRIKIGMEK